MEGMYLQSVQGMVFLVVAFLLVAAVIAAVACRFVRDERPRAAAEMEPLKKAA